MAQRNFVYLMFLIIVSIASCLNNLIAQMSADQYNKMNQATQKLAELSVEFFPEELTELHSLIAAGADVNVRNKDGITPLISAAWDGEIEIVKALLAANADVNAGDSDINAGPLYRAAENGFTEIVRLLLAAGANVNARETQSNSTPLYMAVQNGHVETVKLLLSAKADPNLAIKDGWTPLHKAAYDGPAEIVTLLINSKANVNYRDYENDETPLCLAVTESRIEIVQILLKAGANANVTCFDSVGIVGYTPLEDANMFNKVEIINLLKQYGATE